jgi:threonine/homoserine/homoserine lactone efflux protein
MSYAGRQDHRAETLLETPQMLSLEFLITSFIVVLIPGTGVVFTVSTGLVQGRKASVYAALGCTAGIVPHLLATVLGLAAIMHTSALAFQVLKYAGMAYLFYIAIATWRDTSAFAIDGTSSTATAIGLVMKAFLLNILNPKLTIFFLAFLPQFVQPGTTEPLVQLLFLSATFMAMTFVVFVVYGFLAHAFRKAVVESPRVQAWLRRGFAATFAGLGANLALTEK